MNARPRLTRWQHEALSPFVERYRAMVELGRLSDNELEALRLAAVACTQTNCAAETYRAAQALLRPIHEEQSRRGRSSPLTDAPAQGQNEPVVA